MKTGRRPYHQTARAQAAAQTRTRILEVAAAEFLARWYDEVTLAAVARQAGVSQQTVINHFRSKEGLLEACIEHLDPEQSRRAHPDDPVAGVVYDYERGGDATIRMLALEERVPALRAFMERGRAGHRAWIQEAFADRLSADDGPARDQAIVMHLAATDVYVWKLLRRDMGLSREATTDAMRAMVDALAPSSSTRHPH
jgi:AcrR family transcriptional regulator